MTEQKPKQESAARAPWVPGSAIGPMLFALAAWFLWGPDLEKIPNAPTPKVDRALLTSAPRREAMQDPPTIKLAGSDATCSHCHKDFLSGSDNPRTLLRHKDITLKHGPNVKCSTCHHWKDRNKLALLDGSPLAYADVVKQCAQCHVKMHRDWSRGIHGRTNDFWDAGSGPRRRLGCTQCHNPHTPRSPAMSPIKPLPGPNTLRMRSGEEHHE